MGGAIYDNRSFTITHEVMMPRRELLHSFAEVTNPCIIVVCKLWTVVLSLMRIYSHMPYSVYLVVDCRPKRG